jgi:hypothetical protein
MKVVDPYDVDPYDDNRSLNFTEYIIWPIVTRTRIRIRVRNQLTNTSVLAEWSTSIKLNERERIKSRASVKGI